MNKFTVPFTNGDAGEPGCWIDGLWGQYGSDRVIQIAVSMGFDPEDDDDKTLIEIAGLRLDEIGTRASDSDVLIEKWDRDHPNGYTAWDGLIDLQQECEDWLNDVLLPEDSGYRFGWYDGEFYLWDVATWEESD